MFTANMGELAARFNEEGINSSGSLTKPLRRPPYMSKQREVAEKTIMQIAKDTNNPLGVIIRKVLSDPDSIAQLQSFVQLRGETPALDPTKLAVQAAMLRATEIGLVAKKLDTTDQDALQAIEVSEQEHVEDNSSETAGILSPDTSAALNLMVCRIADRYKNQGGSGKLSDWINRVMKYAGTGSLDKVATGNVINKANGVDDADDYYFGDDDTGGDSNAPSGGFWGNLFDGIDKVVDTVTKVSGAINTTVGNVRNTSGGILDQINNVGSDIGSESIGKYMKANWLTIVGIIVALILFTILIMRVGKR